MEPYRSMIQLEGFEKRYGKKQAVWPLDLEIDSGESFALVGPNGGGKTTMIRAVVGLHRPTGGRIRIDGCDIVRDPERARTLLSYLPQRVAIPGMLTARETVALFARLRRVSQRRVEEMLELFGLASDADRYVREYSGGMVQRLGLAVAFLKDVPVFVLDEPGVNLDPIGVQCLQEHIRGLRKRGATILFSSHVLQQAAQLSDRVAVLVGGRVVKVEEVAVFQSTISSEMVVRVLLERITETMVESARRIGAEVSVCGQSELVFKAPPDLRLNVIRAIERAGGIIEEFHTEVPDWEALIRKHFDVQEGAR